METLIKLLPLLSLVISLHVKMDTTNNFVSVAIVGTNDIHGVAFPTQLMRFDTNESYSYGGLEFMGSMIETVREEYQGNFLYLDAGDQFQGGIESSTIISNGEIMNDFFNTVNVDSSAIGNHEFDFGPGFLFDYYKHRKDGSWALAANLHSQKGQSQFLTKQKNVWLFQLDSGIKIGVIGLSTVQTVYTTNAFNNGQFPPYQFLDYKEIVIKYSKLLRERGANAVLILSHVGNYCDADFTFGIWDQHTKQSSTCNATDEISTLIKGIPVGTIDGVVQGHRHRFSHHFIEGVPVMGTINGGYYFNILHLHFYNKKIYKKEIEGPIPVCEKVFSKLKTCNFQNREELKKAGELVEWEFHGKKVVKHPKVKKLFETKWLPKMKKFLEPFVYNQVLLERTFDGQSMLGHLATDLIDMAFPGYNFIIFNQGFFRTVWYPGVIQYQHFYDMFPLPQLLLSFQMTGRQLIQTMVILQSGRRSFYPTKHLKHHIKIFANGTRKVLNVTFFDGTPIEPDRTYRGISNAFLLNGGDDFDKVKGKIYTPRKEVTLGQFREKVRPFLKKLHVITKEKLIDPDNPRLVIDHQ